MGDSVGDSVSKPATKTENPVKDRSAFGWFIHKTFEGVRSQFARRPKVTIIATVVFLALLFHFRWAYQPLVVGLRMYMGAVIIMAITGSLAWWFTKKRSGKVRFIAIVGSHVLMAFVLFLATPVNRYVTSYLGYNSLKIVDLESLPTTANERVLPKRVVETLVNERVGDSRYSPTEADLVNSGTGDVWTLAIEPSRFFGRFNGQVTEIVKIPADSPSPDFSRTNRIDVKFNTGENMLWGDNIRRCTTRGFGLFRFMNYEPGNILYMQDDNEEWVQVVSLIRWKGIFFPRPEFGGVQILRQEKSVPGWRRFLQPIIGCGQYVSPKKIHKYPFLQGQNLVAPQVSRFIAESFRFQNGFTAPLPGVHKGDIRIPDLSDDVNPQPFTMHFKMPGETEGELYAYFSLEPYKSDALDTYDSRGLSVSLFVPADGSRQVYQYRHADRGASLIGVSAVTPKVEESKDTVNWDQFRPVEHRPFIRTMKNSQGVSETRLLWMTTVVRVSNTNAEDGQRELVAGTMPSIVITDARTGVVVWVDPLKSNLWISEMEEALSGL